jgi:hypothetical protein
MLIIGIRDKLVAAPPTMSTSPVYAPQFPVDAYTCSPSDFRIRVRRIKDPEDKTTVLDESEEYLNSRNELDMTRLNIARPGEVYNVWLLLLHQSDIDC